MTSARRHVTDPEGIDAMSPKVFDMRLPQRRGR